MPIVSPEGKRYSFGELVLHEMRKHHLTKNQAERRVGWLEYHARGWSSPRREKHGGGKT
jgi:hypothetical protein